MGAVAVWANRFGPVMAFSLPPGKDEPPAAAAAPGHFDNGAAAQLSACGSDRSWADHAQALTGLHGTGGTWSLRDAPDDAPLPAVLAQARRDAVAATLSS